MKCKYCRADIYFDVALEMWVDGEYPLGWLCSRSEGGYKHYPDSASVLIEEIEIKITEAYKTLDEIKRLTAQLKEGR